MFFLPIYSKPKLFSLFPAFKFMTKMALSLSCTVWHFGLLAMQAAAEGSRGWSPGLPGWMASSAPCIDPGGAWPGCSCCSSPCAAATLLHSCCCCQLQPLLVQPLVRPCQGRVLHPAPAALGQGQTARFPACIDLASFCTLIYYRWRDSSCFISSRALALGPNSTIVKLNHLTI